MRLLFQVEKRTRVTNEGNKFGPNLNCSFMNWFVNLNQLPTRLYSGQLQPDQLTLLDSESIIDKKK